MVLLISQSKAPNVELGNHLLVHQLVTLCRDGRPTCLADRSGNWSRYASGRRYSPQALRTSTRGRVDDFATVRSPGGRTDDGTMIEGQAPGFATRRTDDIQIVAHAGNGGADESDLRAVREKVDSESRDARGGEVSGFVL